CRGPCKSSENDETTDVWLFWIRITEAKGNESTGMKISPKLGEVPLSLEGVQHHQFVNEGERYSNYASHGQ
ncbi:hypothetical protein, partial [Escherichia coli]|uniref:hypothetical protein n=1 Tax=Escherichia coli TaxID=562 RepID=UPI001A92EED2